MISLIQINKIIVDTIRNILKGTEFEKVPIVNYDVSEGFERPSIKIDLDNNSFENLNSNMMGRSLTVRIYFFATDLKKYKIENLKLCDLIETGLIDGILTDDIFINIEEINSNIVDTVLQIDFDINFDDIRQDKSDQLAEFMWDLELRGGF